MHRYMQCHTLPAAANAALQQSRGTAEPYDGVAEVWWQSMEDLAAALRTPEGRQADRELREDEARFIDLPRSAAWFGDEQVLFGG